MTSSTTRGRWWWCRCDEERARSSFVRQYRAPLDTELLEVPAGKRDVASEPPELTAARELAEEAGMEAGRLELIGHFYNSPGFSDEESWCFLARDLSPCPTLAKASKNST